MLMRRDKNLKWKENTQQGVYILQNIKAGITRVPRPTRSKEREEKVNKQGCIAFLGKSDQVNALRGLTTLFPGLGAPVRFTLDWVCCPFHLLGLGSKSRMLLELRNIPRNH